MFPLKRFLLVLSMLVSLPIATVQIWPETNEKKANESTISNTDIQQEPIAKTETSEKDHATQQKKSEVTADADRQNTIAQSNTIVTIECVDGDVVVPYDIATISETIVTLMQDADHNQESYSFPYNDATRPLTANCITAAEMQLIVDLLTSIKQYNDTHSLKEIIQNKALADVYINIEKISACIENFLHNAPDRYSSAQRMALLSDHFDLPLVQALIEWYDTLQTINQATNQTTQSAALAISDDKPSQPVDNHKKDLAQNGEQSIGWTSHDVKELDIPRELFSENFGIRQYDCYKPAVTEGTSNIIFVVIHGTWGGETDSFFTAENSNNQNYNYIKRTAAFLATSKRKNLKLLSLRWTGKWSDDDRQSAAIALHSFLDHKGYIANNDEIVVFGHSHGCNIANYLTHLMPSEKSIQWLIYFACPRRKEEYYQPLHYKSLIYFYSDADMISRLARANEEDVMASPLGILIKGAAIGAQLWFKPGTSQIANHLKTLTTDVLRYNSKTSVTPPRVGFAEIVENVLHGTHEFQAQNGKITIGLRTTVDGHKPDHSEIVDCVQYLKEIMETIQRSYIDHYSVSSTFNLNLDRQNSDNPVLLAIRSRGNAAQPTQFDYLVENNRAHQPIIMPAAIPSQARQSELQLSDKEKNRFMTRYGRNIHE